MSHLRGPRMSPALAAQSSAAKLQELVRRAQVVARAGEPIRLRASQVVARVNGVPLTGRHLLPFRDAGGEHVMPAERYGLLLKKAIERELTFQAARARGIELNAGQRQQVERLRQSLEEELNRSSPNVRRLTDPPDIEFEVQRATSYHLLTALLKQEGVRSSAPTLADIDKYYQDHQDEFGELPTDPAKRRAAMQQIRVKISLILAPEMQGAYSEHMAQYLDELKAKADISDG